jgi:hypothetical protein
MGLFRRRTRSAPPATTAAPVISTYIVTGMFEAATMVAFEAGEQRGWDLIELDVIGESHYQDALERVAGTRTEYGKHELCGITLRCEPANQYDANAIRVETYGQFLGHIPHATAATMSPLMLTGCGGCIEGIGVIVGGWASGRFRDEHGRYTEAQAPGARREDQGSYGVRVWVNRAALKRVSIDCDAVRLR